MVALIIATRSLKKKQAVNANNIERGSNEAKVEKRGNIQLKELHKEEREETK